MPILYSDYKIKCPFYGSTRNKKIVCQKGFSCEFTSEELMNAWKENNCCKIDGYKCRARKALIKDAVK